MKTEEFRRVEHLVETTSDEIDKLYDGLNILKQLPEVVSIKVLGRNENVKYTSVDGFYYVAPDIILENIPDAYLDQQLNLNFGEVVYSFDK